MCSPGDLHTPIELERLKGMLEEAREPTEVLAWALIDIADTLKQMFALMEEREVRRAAARFPAENHAYRAPQ